MSFYDDLIEYARTELHRKPGFNGGEASEIDIMEHARWIACYVAARQYLEANTTKDVAHDIFSGTFLEINCQEDLKAWCESQEEWGDTCDGVLSAYWPE